jgi:hypothetical protein
MYATDIKMKTAIVADLTTKLGDCRVEVLASEASAINAMTTIMQTMNIILFDSIELDSVGDAFSFPPPLS